MKKSEFIELLRLRCGNRKDADFANIVTLEASYVQKTELEANGRWYPWFLESEWAEASLIADEERIPLPESFLAEIEGQVLQVKVDNVWLDLEKKRYDEMLKQYGTEATGQPKVYDISGDYFLFRPVPEKTYQIRMRFYKRDIDFALLTDSQTNKFLTHASDLMLGAVGRVIAAEHIQDEALTAKFQTQFAEASDRIYAITEAREHANRTYRMEG